ncbi:MAG: nucleotidyltransferase domain-containing protein [Candidatus Omnitrophica bacterium]|nr:nucleotidyltransferase domain-containing protein [Candidatus Omnitrophota bacterium]
MRLTEQEQRAVERFATTLRERWGNEVLEIHLFGSKARGDAGPESDVDLLIVTERNDWKLKDEIGRVATRILLSEGIYLSIKVLGKTLYQRLVTLEAPFIKNVLREGVVV